MQRSEALRIQDMYDATTDIARFLIGRSRNDLEEDRMLARALVATIQIIGEAANHVDPSTRERHPEIEWNEAIGMRNHLVHGYFDIDYEVLWDTVNNDIPRLRQQLEPIISLPGLGL